jgi:hypothetical protein
MSLKNLNGTLKNYPLTHLPTLVLIVGTLSFWIELYFIRLPYGHSSWLAWVIFIFCLLALCSSRRVSLRALFFRAWQSFSKEIASSLENAALRSASRHDTVKIIIAISAFLGLVYLGIGLYASFLPPHLVQESDALAYHITLPRQHLIHHSFAHIPWSTPDFFLLPLDYALSPFELATTWPNKLIQFVFFAGCLGCVFHLVYILSGQAVGRAWCAVLAIMAFHAIAIQVGLAMLDLVMLYCFLAFIHSLLIGRLGLAAVEFGFFFWSKSFIPLQMMAIGIMVALILFWVLKKGFSCDEISIPDKRGRKMFITVFLAASLGIALPYLIKSFYYTGTPFYPFGIGFLPPLVKYAPDHWHSILQRAADCLAVKNDYGHGRSIIAFLKHFWLIAVPEKGVNNTFDYPVGLIYLLFLAPFFGHAISSLKSRKLPVLSLMVMIWWMTWWVGSQQSRFLLVPICLMIIVSISFLPKVSRVLIVLIIIVLGLEVISLANAHRHDWGKPFSEVLRDKDKKLLEYQPPAGVEVELNFPDVAFASFPVTVHRSDSVYVIHN